MGQTILVVDDNQDVVTITERILTLKGYEVVTALDGEKGLALAATARPACILLDIMMPRMSGIDVLSALKRNPDTATIPVILVTACGRDENVLEGYREGADYYITKPCTSEQLVYGIRLVLGELDDGDPVEPDRA
jgi:DNA-binding response OmpR family regulator